MTSVLSEEQVIIKRWPVYLDLLSLHRGSPVRYPYLLASTSQASTNSSQSSSTDRYDILMAFPQARLELWPKGLLSSEGLNTTASGFLSALDDCWREIGRASCRERVCPYV